MKNLNANKIINYNDEYKSIREAISKRWDELGLTKGLSGSVNEKLSALYESKPRQLLQEPNITNK